MATAIMERQRGFLSSTRSLQVARSSGSDTQLIDDGTYFVIEQDQVLAGCGGWSRRATLYGGD